MKDRSYQWKGEGGRREGWREGRRFSDQGGRVDEKTVISEEDKRNEGKTEGRGRGINREGGGEEKKKVHEAEEGRDIVNVSSGGVEGG